MQQGPSSVAPAAPVLVIVRDSGTGDSEPSILGLGLIARTISSAGRCGYSRIYCVAADRSGQQGVTTVSDWGSLADAFAQQSAPLLIAHAAVLAESDWLAQLASRPLDMWAARSGKLLMLPATAVAEAFAILDVDSGAHTFSEAQERLTHHFGQPAEIPVAIDPILVMTQADVDAAERRLLQGLVKNTDGFMARNVERPMSLRIVRRLASTGVTPNQMTLLSVGIGLCGAPFFLSPYWLWQTVGAVLFLAHSILDGCDGELARLKFQESRFGGIIDYWGDNVVHIAVFSCMAVGWSLSVSASWPMLLGVSAVLGNLGSAWFVYWRTMHARKDSGPLFTSVATLPGQTLARMLDAASRRDFIYLVVFLALFGKSNWFLVLAAIGAPVFLLLLVLLAMRERFQTA